MSQYERYHSNHSCILVTGEREERREKRTEKGREKGEGRRGKEIEDG